MANFFAEFGKPLAQAAANIPGFGGVLSGGLSGAADFFQAQQAEKDSKRRKTAGNPLGEITLPSITVVAPPGLGGAPVPIAPPPSPAAQANMGLGGMAVPLAIGGGLLLALLLLRK